MNTLHALALAAGFALVASPDFAQSAVTPATPGVAAVGAPIELIPDGEALGVIALPKAPQNLAFAGADKRTQYVVGRGAVCRIATLAAGNPGRAS